MLWSGSASSAVDLNPTGFKSSLALATDGTDQVGLATTTAGSTHAFFWSGSANSALDLQAALPASFTYSRASLVSGSSVYGFATDGTGNYPAIEWTVAIPEPTSAATLPLAVLLCQKRRGRKLKGNCTVSNTETNELT